MPRSKGIFTKRKSPAKPNLRAELDDLRALLEKKENVIIDLKAKYEEMNDYKSKYEDLIKVRLSQFEELEGSKMAFILGVTGKLLGNHTADLQQILGFQISPKGIQNDLESVWKCFSSEEMLNFEKNIT